MRYLYLFFLISCYKQHPVKDNHNNPDAGQEVLDSILNDYTQ